MPISIPYIPYYFSTTRQPETEAAAFTFSGNPEQSGPIVTCWRVLACVNIFSDQTFPPTGTSRLRSIAGAEDRELCLARWDHHMGQNGRCLARQKRKEKKRKEKKREGKEKKRKGKKQERKKKRGEKEERKKKEKKYVANAFTQLGFISWLKKTITWLKNPGKITWLRKAAADHWLMDANETKVVPKNADGTPNPNLATHQILFDGSLVLRKARRLPRFWLRDAMRCLNHFECSPRSPRSRSAQGG